MFIAALGTSEIREKDILMMDSSHPEFDLEQFCQENHLEMAEIRSQSFSQQAKSIGMAEITLVPDSDCIGKTIGVAFSFTIWFKCGGSKT